MCDHVCSCRNPESLVFSNIRGFILNIPNPSYNWKWTNIFAMPLNLITKKHWISICKHVDGNYYNLDSKLDAPAVIGGVSTVAYY